jgi:hypothetical protein
VTLGGRDPDPADGELSQAETAGARAPTLSAATTGSHAEARLIMIAPIADRAKGLAFEPKISAFLRLATWSNGVT